MGTESMVRGAMQSATHGTAWNKFQERQTAEQTAMQNRTDRLRRQADLRSQFNAQAASSRAAQPTGAAPKFTPGKQSSFGA